MEKMGKIMNSCNGQRGGGESREVLRIGKQPARENDFEGGRMLRKGGELNETQ